MVTIYQFSESRTCNAVPRDIVFVVDSSSSVGTTSFGKVMSWMTDVVSNIDIDGGTYRIGFVVYNTQVTKRVYLNQAATRVLQEIQNTYYSYGNTNTAAALRTAREEVLSGGHGRRAGVSGTIVLITDGISNMNSRHTVPEANSAKAAGIQVYAIGIGLADTDEIDGIVSEPLSVHRIMVNSYDDIPAISNDLFDGVCTGGMKYFINIFQIYQFNSTIQTYFKIYLVEHVLTILFLFYVRFHCKRC